jgi:hypothetical protein
MKTSRHTVAARRPWRLGASMGANQVGVFPARAQAPGSRTIASGVGELNVDDVRKPRPIESAGAFGALGQVGRPRAAAGSC